MPARPRQPPGRRHWRCLQDVYKRQMYIPATIAIAYTLYVKHTDTTRISNACAPASRRLCRHKWMRNLLDVVIVFGIMGGKMCIRDRP